MRNQVARIITTFLVALVVIPTWGDPTHGPNRQFSAASPSPQITDRAAQRPIPANSEIRKIGNIPSIGETDFRNVQIEFISQRLGWIYAGGKLWKTEDGGESWLLVYDASTNYIWQVVFVEPNVGWMIASSKLYRTEDGGSTWALSTQPIPPPFKGKLYACKFFKDGLRGWVAGGLYTPIPKAKPGEENTPPSRYLSTDMKHELHGAIFYTKDGGKTWHRQLLTPRWGNLTVLFALDENHAWATGTAGRFYLRNKKWKEMDDGGRNQEGMTLVKSLNVEIGFPTYQPACIFFLNTSSGWLSNSNGYLAVSSDGGKKWLDMSPPVGVKNGLPVYFTRLFFKDQMNGWGCGYDGGLYKTKDGGVSWEKQDLDAHFDDMYFLESGDGWAVAKEGLFRINFRDR